MKLIKRKSTRGPMVFLSLVVFVTLLQSTFFLAIAAKSDPLLAQMDDKSKTVKENFHVLKRHLALGSSDFHNHDRDVKKMATMVEVDAIMSEQAKSRWCAEHADDYIRSAHLYCPPTWCNFDESFRVCGGHQLHIDVVIRSPNSLAVWVVPKVPHASSFDEMLESFPMAAVGFLRALLSHIKGMWKLQQGYQLRVLPIFKNNSRRDIYLEAVSYVPPMSRGMHALAARSGFVISLVGRKQSRASVNLKVARPLLPVPQTTRDKRGGSSSTTFAAAELMLKETPLARVFLDAVARSVVVVTPRRLDMTPQQPSSTDMGNLTNAELVDFFRAGITVVGWRQWADMRLNTGEHQSSCSSLCLEVWVDDIAFGKKFGANAVYVALRRHHATLSTDLATDNNTCNQHIIQVGEARSASTLQFVVLCSLVVMWRPQCPVECSYNQWSSQMGGILVSKTHRSDRAIAHHANANGKNVRIFSTAMTPFVEGSTGPSVSRYNSTLFRRATLVVHLEQAANSSVEDQVRQYVPHFDGLTERAFQVVVDFIRAWIPIRRCCGLQMSKYHRERLVNKSAADNNDICAQVDIHSAEAQLMHTELYSRFMNTSWLAAMARPSTIDGALNGTYCEAHERNVMRFNLTFNQQIP